MRSIPKALGLALLASLIVFPQRIPAAAVLEPGFTFFAGGDTGYGGTGYGDLGFSTASHGAIQPSFFLQLGDISYNGTSRNNTGYGNEASWCNFVKSHVHNRLGDENYPYELIAGNHENTVKVDGFIGNSTLDGYKTCLPNRIGTIHFANETPDTIPGACDSVTECYAYEYYFDYPQTNPIARFIGLAANLSIAENGVNHKYNYCDSECPNQTSSKKHLKWLNETITDSKLAGYWTIVFFHKPCMSVGDKACEGGGDLLDTLINQKVDLVLNGHDHLYQRSKQLDCRGPVKPTRSTEAVYDPGCVVDDGSDGSYTRGKGMVQVVAGNFGGGAFTSITANDPELNYFSKAMGGNVSGLCCWRDGAFWDTGAGAGLLKITITRIQLTVEQITTTIRRSVASGEVFSDNFEIKTPEQAFQLDTTLIVVSAATLLTVATLVFLRLRSRKKNIQS